MNKHLPTAAEIRAGLREAFPSAVPPPAPAFWARFRAKAALAPLPAAPARRHSAWRPLWASAVAGAGAVALLALAPWFLRNGQARPAGALSGVEDLSVYGEYSSIFIIQDGENQGTIVWVAGWEGPARQASKETPL